MFYYPNVLRRHSGCFSTIWLAATKGIRISRREYLKVNIRRTCEDIVDYVMVKVPPVHPSLPRPRFSLYLSSQLQYGVIIVYHRQCAFLLEEVQQTIEHLLRSERNLRIDMPEADRLVLNVPNSLFQLEEGEWALDPFFGVMGVGCELPTPSMLPESRPMTEPSSPLVVRKEITVPKGLTASPESITIKDAYPMPVLPVEFGGAELPEATAQEIDMLMEQQDQFHNGDEEDKERERAREMEQSETDDAMISIEQLKNSESIVDDGSTHLIDVALDRVALEMTPPPITMPPITEASEKDVEQEQEMEHSFETPSVETKVLPKKRGKRQLIFADQQTQISQDAMRQQINNPLIETHSLSDVLLNFPASRKPSAAVLLSTPCNLLIHPDLQSLWKCCSVAPVLPRPSRKRHAQDESELSEIEKERGMDLIKESSREVVRESSEAALVLSELSAASDVPLDVSKDDKSQTDLITPTSRCRSPIEEAPDKMEVILEEHVELPQGEMEPDIRDVNTSDLLRLIMGFIKRFGKVFFHSLLPPEAERSTAAHLFYKTLELTCARKLSVHQTEPFGVITITMER